MNSGALNLSESGFEKCMKKSSAIGMLPPGANLPPIQFQQFIVPSVFLEGAIRAEVQTLLAGIGARKYQMAKGELPRTLMDLVPAYLPGLRKDPFIPGDFLRLKAETNSVVIYSVGANGVDENGMESAWYTWVIFESEL